MGCNPNLHDDCWNLEYQLIIIIMQIWITTQLELQSQTSEHHSRSKSDRVTLFDYDPIHHINCNSICYTY